MAGDAWLTLLCAAHSSHAGRWRRALAAHGSPEALVAARPSALAAAGLNDDDIARLASPDVAALDRWRSWLAGSRRDLIPLDDPRYPPLLAQLSDPPLALWVHGDKLDLLTAPQLAMVGSRNPTAGGRDTAQQFAKYLSEHGLTITSGLAIGIDGASHRGALEGPSGTIAVLGSGIDVIYPRAHLELARQVAERGLLVSEYAPGTKTDTFHFPQRNRIIAGLALGTLVVEATRHSGSLITARAAMDNGREVFAIPGSIHSPLARGCHALIRQGAKLVEEAADIFIELAPQLAALLAVDVETLRANARQETTQPMQRFDDPVYRNVLSLLDFAPQSIGDLSGRAGLTTAELSSMLLVLELEGFVEALPGGRYSRLAKRE
ncbi:MAG TPA: DNA-processing protein DprA [Gammaproteobacteria bacterium]|nr:DNA-processing protein DprA [Gammaproteobacteria bacterium]